MAEQKYYKLDTDGWKEFDVNIDSQGLSISLYELNKSAFSSAKPLTKEQLVVYAEEINNFVQEGQEYFMLLCKECSYYTILKDEKIGDGLGTVAFECLEACGEIVAVSNETDHYEIWVKNNKTNLNVRLNRLKNISSNKTLNRNDIIKAINFDIDNYDLNFKKK